MSDREQLYLLKVEQQALISHLMEIGDKLHNNTPDFRDLMSEFRLKREEINIIERRIVALEKKWWQWWK